MTNINNEQPRDARGKWAEYSGARPQSTLTPGWDEEVETVDLSDPPLMLVPDPPEPSKPFLPALDTGKGTYSISNPMVENMPSEDGFTRRTLHLNGQPEVRAHNNTVAELMHEGRGPGSLPPGLMQEAESGQPKVTVLLAGPKGNISAAEGTLVLHGGRPVLLQKGTRSGRGFYLDTGASRVLSWERGYGHAGEMAERWHAASQQVPVVEKTHFDGLPDIEAQCARTGEYVEPPREICAVYLMEHPGFGGRPSQGCLFLATDYDADGDIVNGYMWAPGDSDLTSEHGSMYGRDLGKWGGRVSNYRSGSLRFSDCWKNLDDDRASTYRTVLSGVHLTTR